MEFSNVTIGLNALTEKNINELRYDMDNYKLLETDTKNFLIYFCRNNILSSLFMQQISNLSMKAIMDFQENTFNFVKIYFEQLIGIDDLNITYNPDVYPLIMSISISDMVLCNIDIFNKTVEILEDFYFKDILSCVQKLNDEKLELEKQFNKYSEYAIDSMSILKENDMSFLKNLDIMASSLKKNNKYKVKYEQECNDISNRIYQIDNELEEYYLIESNLRKNMMHLNYYQARIADRISRHLKYKVIKN